MTYLSATRSARIRSLAGLNGRCNVVDNVADVMVKCLDVTAIVQSANAVTILGNATANGATTTYRIDAVDNAEPGQGRDVFTIETASGYSRSGVLSAGNVQGRFGCAVGEPLHHLGSNPGLVG